MPWMLRSNGRMVERSWLADGLVAAEGSLVVLVAVEGLNAVAAKELNAVAVEGSNALLAGCCS